MVDDRTVERRLRLNDSSSYTDPVIELEEADVAVEVDAEDRTEESIGSEKVDTVGEREGDDRGSSARIFAPPLVIFEGFTIGVGEAGEILARVVFDLTMTGLI